MLNKKIFLIFTAINILLLFLIIFIGLSGLDLSNNFYYKKIAGIGLLIGLIYYVFLWPSLLIVRIIRRGFNNAWVNKKGVSPSLKFFIYINLLFGYISLGNFELLFFIVFIVSYPLVIVINYLVAHPERQFIENDFLIITEARMSSPYIYDKKILISEINKFYVSNYLSLKKRFPDARLSNLSLIKKNLLRTASSVNLGNNSVINNYNSQNKYGDFLLVDKKNGERTIYQLNNKEGFIKGLKLNDISFEE